MRPLVAACWALAAAGAAISGLRGDTTLNVATEPGSGIMIRLSLLPAQPSRFGFEPVRVTIENGANREGTWFFHFESGAIGRPPGLSAFEQSFTVPGGQTRESWMFVPTAEPGQVGGSPVIAGDKIDPPAAAGAGTSSWLVVISKTATGTRIVRRPRVQVGAVGLTVEQTIDATTGEHTTTTSVGTGIFHSNHASSTRPPPGSEVTYRIDPSTGMVGTTTRPNAAPAGAVKVNIVTSAAGPAARAPTVTIAKIPSGTRIVRTSRLSDGSTFAVQRDIDQRTGAITTTFLGPARAGAPRVSAPFAAGTDTTLTINPLTGTVHRRTQAGPDPAAPPKVRIVTAAAGTPGGGRALPPSPFVAPGFLAPHMVLSAQVSGPGVTGKSGLAFPNLSGTENMHPIAAAAGLEAAVRASLMQAGIKTPDLALVEPAQLPADWRVWTPFAAVLLTTADFDGLDAARRAALRGWVGLGGRLLLFPTTAGGVRRVEAIGAGEIVSVAVPLPESPTPADLAGAGLTLGAAAGHPDQATLTVEAGSALGAAARVKEPRLAFVSIFLLAFAALVGPVNLFVFAPAGKRHRLFLTTPLISLAAALVLGTTILVQDGLGGDGARRAIVALLPDDNQAAIFQEQSSRTGFLSGRSFALDDDTALASLRFDDGETAAPFNGMSGAADERGFGHASGDWFRSRSRQSEQLRRLVPSRARVERVGTAPNGAPMVESSLATVLRQFTYRDRSGGRWNAAELVPGRVTTLAPSGAGSAAERIGGTENLRQIWTAAKTGAGRWAARGGPTEFAPIPTLNRVRWTNDEIWYTGMLKEKEAPL